jgi:hypothetical protein
MSNGSGLACLLAEPNWNPWESLSAIMAFLQPKDWTKGLVRFFLSFLLSLGHVWSGCVRMRPGRQQISRRVRAD